MTSSLFPAGAGRLTNINNIAGGVFDTLHFEDKYLTGQRLSPDYWRPGNDGNIVLGQHERDRSSRPDDADHNRHGPVLRDYRPAKLRPGHLTRASWATLVRRCSGRAAADSRAPGLQCKLPGDVQRSGGVASVEEQFSTRNEARRPTWSSAAATSISRLSHALPRGDHLSGSGAGGT